MNKKRVTVGAVLFWCVMALSGAAWCGDGTVKLGTTLVVLEDAWCLGNWNAMNWGDAMKWAKALADGQCGLRDKSKPGDWRLPNLDELKRIHSAKSQFKNVQAYYYYWSSSTYAGDRAWIVRMNDGNVHNSNKTYPFFVWPVRAVK